MIDNDIYKERSLKACLTSATGLFVDNIKTILSKTWWPILAYVAILSLLAIFSQPFSGTMVTPDGTLGIDLKDLILFLALILVSLAGGCVINAIVLGLLNSFPLKTNMLRNGRLALAFVGIMLLIGVLTSGLSFAVLKMSQAAGWDATASLSASGLTGLVLLLLWLVLLIPICYSSMKYLMESQQRLPGLIGKPYRKGWKFWGFLFGISILTLLLMTILHAFANAPAIVLQLAQGADRAGVLMGDASGLPSSFPWLLYGVYVITAFISVYISIWTEFIYIYAYGSIETRLNNRQNNNIQ